MMVFEWLDRLGGTMWKLIVDGGGRGDVIPSIGGNASDDDARGAMVLELDGEGLDCIRSRRGASLDLIGESLSDLIDGGQRTRRRCRVDVGGSKDRQCYLEKKNG